MWEEGWWVIQDVAVTPCEGRVSRNILGQRDNVLSARHALRGACE